MDTGSEKENQLVPAGRGGMLSDPQFHQLAEMPSEAEWFFDIHNEHTKRAYRKAVSDFQSFVGIDSIDQFREIARGHAIAWRDHLTAAPIQVRALRENEEAFECPKQKCDVELPHKHMSPATIRLKLSALTSLYDYLVDKNAVQNHPFKGITRPKEGSNEGKTLAISDAQAQQLLDSPPPDTLKGVRDRAILATFLFAGLRVEELAKLKVKSLTEFKGLPHLRFLGKRSKWRKILMAPTVQQRIREYLAMAGHADDEDGPLFRPLRNNNPSGVRERNTRQHRRSSLRRHMNTSSLWDMMRHYGMVNGLKPEQCHPHVGRTTAITNALDNGADLKRVSGWAGHASVSTTQLYDKRHERPEDSPSTFIKFNRSDS